MWLIGRLSLQVSHVSPKFHVFWKLPPATTFHSWYSGKLELISGRGYFLLHINKWPSSQRKDNRNDNTSAKPYSTVFHYRHCFVCFRSLPNIHVLAASNPGACTIVDSQRIYEFVLKLKGQESFRAVSLFFCFRLFVVAAVPSAHDCSKVLWCCLKCKRVAVRVIGQDNLGS